MLKPALIALATVTVVSCTSSRDQMFMAMSDSELTEYNAALPARDQIECREEVRRGTVGLVRKVCTSKIRMARLSSRGSNNLAFDTHNQGFYGNRTYFDDRSKLPRIYFSPPPPGYTGRTIHVLPSDNRR